jgi:hypothetical protein
MVNLDKAVAYETYKPTTILWMVLSARNWLAGAGGYNSLGRLDSQDPAHNGAPEPVVKLGSDEG